ncbi:hypothetical protein D3C73_1504300 [compost metagenome]
MNRDKHIFEASLGFLQQLQRIIGSAIQVVKLQADQNLDPIGISLLDIERSR